jgi:heme exporter protein A
MELICKNICKSFAERSVLRNISFSIKNSQAMAIVGPNGSGKTTLLRLICYLNRPSEGLIKYYLNGKELEPMQLYKHLGLVGPYLELYEELSAMENLMFFAKMKNLKNASERIFFLLDKFKLSGREQDHVKTYSSGMKQRLKYVSALLNDPDVLLVDEPRANLDEEGIQTVYNVLKSHKQDKILIIATNDQDDLKFADWELNLNA